MDVVPKTLDRPIGDAGRPDAERSAADGGNPFALPRRSGFGWLALLLERLLGLSSLAQRYSLLPRDLAPAEFVDKALNVLGVSWADCEGRADEIPDRGPVIVVANHPYGAAEGMALTAMLLRRRPDTRLLANVLLTRLPGLAPLIFPVDVFKSGVNGSGIRQARRHLEAGGALLMFPAGEVSRLRWGGLRRQAWRVADPDWTDTAAMLARKCRASVVPVGVGGRATLGSLLAGFIHPRLRTLRLARDLLALRGQRLALHVGKAIPPAELARVPQASQTAYMRCVTEALYAQGEVRKLAKRAMQTVDAPIAPDHLRAAVAALPSEFRLFRQDEFDVYCVPGVSMGVLLDEIARLRELSFRLVEEGTGLSRDTDRFDRWYRHLFLWHRSSGAIVGAYRLGYTDEILPQHGVKGLYTHTLFDFDRQLFAHTGPAVELGRSFVNPEWQRSFHPLRLLWAGIARLVEQDPAIRMLFGPVSVSAAYSTIGRQLIADSLIRHRGDDVLRPLVSPRNPLTRRADDDVQRSAVSGLADPQLLSRLVSRVERGPGLPVLLRHYLDLDARFAGFNVDDDFGGALDGLVMVRVANIPPRILERFKSAAAPAASADARG